MELSNREKDHKEQETQKGTKEKMEKKKMRRRKKCQKPLQKKTYLTQENRIKIVVLRQAEQKG